MNLEKLINLANSFMASRIILTAVEIDLFTIIGKNLISVEEVSSQLNISIRGAQIILNALSARGVLEKINDKYKNTDASQKFLDKSSPDYRGGMFTHLIDLWNSWSSLTEVLKTGKSAWEIPSTKTSPGFGEGFLMSMCHRGWEVAGNMAKLLDLSRVKKMLDLGGGPGSYSITFAKNNPNLKAVVFDLPFATEFAKKVISEAGLEDRVSVQSGDFLIDDIGSDYDLVLISNIIHSYGEERNKIILSKAYQCLNEDGRVVINDFLLDDNMISPIRGAIFSVNMLINTPQGRAYAFSEIKSWLEETGFKNIQSKNINDESRIAIGTK